MLSDLCGSLREVAEVAIGRVGLEVGRGGEMDAENGIMDDGGNGTVMAGGENRRGTRSVLQEWLGVDEGRGVEEFWEREWFI